MVRLHEESMSAELWKEHRMDSPAAEQFRFAPAEAGDPLQAHRAGESPRERRCPACCSIVYSRRHALCGVCEHELPASIRFGSGQSERVTALIELERRKHRRWLQRMSTIPC